MEGQKDKKKYIRGQGGRQRGEQKANEETTGKKEKNGMEPEGGKNRRTRGDERGRRKKRQRKWKK